MTGIETNFRLRMWKERLKQIVDEMATAAAEIPDSPRRDRMIEATLYMNRAIEKCDFARAIPGDKDETELLLKLSVQDFHGRRRCAEIAAEPPASVTTFPGIQTSPMKGQVHE